MALKLKKNILISILLTVGLFLSLTGCNSSKPLIIDGAKAREIENRINTLAYDQSLELRGNSVSNIRNGGNVIIGNKMFYIIQEMNFDEDVFYYLQKIPSSTIGTLAPLNELLIDLDASIVGIKEETLYYINNIDHIPYKMDVGTLIQTRLFEEPVTAFRIFNNEGFVSSEVDSAIYKVDLEGKLEATLLIENGGTIVTIQDEKIYTLEDNKDESVLLAFNRSSGDKVFSLVGGPFRDAEITGSFIFYRDEEVIKRKLLDGDCDCVSASVIPTKEYAIYNNKLVISGLDKGLYLSLLDGSHIVLLSEDKANSIQLFDDYLFYKNEHDYNSWYVIKFSEETRSALLGETMSDGGIKFDEANSYLSESFSQYYEGFIDEIKGHTSNKNTTQTQLGPSLLFVDTRGEEYSYYSHVDYPFTAENCDGIVVITNKDTVLGQYTDGDIAYRKDSVLTLFAPGNTTPLMSVISEGYPPIDIKVGKGDRYGIPTSWHQKGLLILNKVK